MYLKKLKVLLFYVFIFLLMDLTFSFEPNTNVRLWYARTDTAHCQARALNIFFKFVPH